MHVAGEITVRYAYEGSDAFWTEKTISNGTGDVHRSFQRLELLRRAFDARPRAIFRGPQNERAAEYVDGTLTYLVHLAGDPVARYARDGSFLNLIASPYGAEDEVTVLPDGSVELTVYGPRSSTEFESEAGPILRITMPRAVTAPRHALTMSGHNCDWVPGGYVGYGGYTAYTEGHWECAYYTSDGGGGGSGGGATSGGGGAGMPASQPQQLKLNASLSIAKLAVQKPDCASLFNKHGARGDGLAILGASTYRNGIGTRRCPAGAAASTNLLSYTVYLCTEFQSLSNQEAAVRLIHEALHTAGQNENPPDPNSMSSRAINDLVKTECGI